MYTTAALVAFALNSILCRLALGTAAIDPASFTTIRLGSGAVALALLATASRATHVRLKADATTAVRSLKAGAATVGRSVRLQLDGTATAPRDWIAAIALAGYAIAFSFAYVSLSAGTGALLLFGAVQATMILVALGAGERAPLMEWVGLSSALVGLIYLVSPGLAAPSPIGSILMIAAGVCWGVYSLCGRGSENPLQATARNFARALPLAIVAGAAAVITGLHVRISPGGVLLASLAGAITSGFGYVLWYAALRNLTAIRAAIVQLSVPVLAAAGGVVFLRETISLRLATAAALILGGVALAVSAGSKRPRS